MPFTKFINQTFYGLLATVVILSFFISFNACNTMKKKVDLIVFNGIVYTVDSTFSKAEAFAVADGKFVAVGSNHEIIRNYESDRVVDANNEAIYPGFIDGHCHFFGLGENLVRYAELSGSKSFEEVLNRLSLHAEKHPDEWILGRGWDQNLWEDKAFPTNQELNKRFPEKKIILIRIDGHAALVNDAVLELAGMNGKSKVEGGKILLDENGKPTGLLVDKAYEKVQELIPPLSKPQQIQALMEAQKACFSVGLSGVTDAGLPLKKILLIDSLQSTGKLKMKINAMIDPDDETTTFFFNKGPVVKDRLSVRSVKLYADGALGSRGALLIEPYSDDPGSIGLMMYDTAYYQNICQRAYDAGYQVNTHAIGDGGNRFVLNLYAKYLKGKNDRRWRIEHAQVVNEKDFNLFGAFNIIPSIQSTHATSDMLWAPDRLGADRMKGAYAQQKLLRQNGWLINGTDFPIESINPIKTFYAAVVRKNEQGVPEHGFQMEDALSRDEALRSITLWPAKGAFEEKLKGSIEVGKAADFVILDRDIMQIKEDEILQSEVLLLVVSGEKVFPDTE